MTQDGGVPRDFWGRIEKMIDTAVGKLARSGMLRNATISDGGLTIKGGFLRLVYKTFNMVYFGPVGGVLGDGNVQQYLVVRRADGTAVLRLWDAFPDPDGTLNQALSWLDRGGNAVFADDTDSGQGIARPYVPFVFYRSRSQDWPTMSDSTFTTIYRAEGVKQQPKLHVKTWAWAVDPGATAEVQVLVNGVVWGAPQVTAAGMVTQHIFGPAVVTDAHMSTLSIEVQCRRASGVGDVRCGPARIEGRQT